MSTLVPQAPPQEPAQRSTPRIGPTVNGIPAYRMSMTWTLGQPADCSYTVYGPDGIDLHAGQIPPTAHGILPLSLDGSGIDMRMLSNGAQLVYDQPGYVTESGKCLGLALQHTPIHRFTAQQITTSDAFIGQANAIITTDTSAITNILPDQQGIGLTSGAVSWTYVVDPAIANLVLDLDINEDNMLHATQIICQHMASFADPQHTQFYIDPGDLGPGGPQSVVVGAKGGRTIAFDGTTIPILRMTTSQAQTTDMCASVTFKGGDSHHGLPTAGKMTDLRCAGDGTPLLAVYAKIDQGGVFFWPGDGSIYPLSQAMGVNALWYDDDNQVIYAATDAGIYTRLTDAATNLSPMQRLGFMSLKCTRVQREVDQVYGLVEFSGTSERWVLKYDLSALGGYGYDGFAPVVSHATVTDFAAMGDYIYCLLNGFPGMVYYQQLSTGGHGQLTIPGSAQAIGIDAISATGNGSQGVFVRTDQGSTAFFYIDQADPSSIVQANTDGLLVDDYGQPVLVNSVRANPSGMLVCTTAQVHSELLAATSMGVWSCPDPTGARGWQRTDGQSSIGDFNATYAAATGGGTYNGHVLRCVYAISESAFYYSNNGSVNWIDAFSEPLDAGPYFYNYFRRQNRWPQLSDTSIPVPFGGGTYVLDRILNGLSQFSYVLRNPTSAAPALQHRSGELSQISAPANFSELTASRLLVEAMGRFLAYTSQPQVVVEVESYFDDPASPLRTLRPTDAATVAGAPMEYLIAPGLAPFQLGTWAGTFYILQHTITYDRDQDPGGCTTKTRLGSLLLDDRTDPLRVTADLWFQTSRNTLYRTRSRR